MKTVDDLREQLFATLAALRDPTQPLEVARAKAISEVAQTIINTAKLEIDHMRATGADAAASGFLPAVPSDKLPVGIVGIRTHRIKG